jgi:proteasome component ECM29
MGLATHNALWNSKKGAAFAASFLSSHAGGKVELKGHMEQLIPKLFRSSYDPSYNVSQSMTRILDSFATRKEIHENYFDIIVQDLLENVWNLQWRTREASCNALADILTGVTMEKVEPYISDIWAKVFKVCSQ